MDGIDQLATQYIFFPYTVQQQLPVKRGFYSIAGLHNVIGTIDCTHVRIKAPSPDPFPYLNRKQYHSINVQVICDSVNHLLNVVSRFPGGAHDSYFMQNSSVGMRLEQGAAGDAWLIGKHLELFQIPIFGFTKWVSSLMTCFRAYALALANDPTNKASDAPRGLL